MVISEPEITAMNVPAFPPASPNLPRLRVLLADDSPQVRQDLRQLLELSGEIEIVAEAGNGQEAVQLAASLEPDVVVMDLEMPCMSGYEAAHQIKSLFPAMRVVILSVHAGAKEQENARIAGADCFIVKGVRYAVLLNAILARENKTNLVDPSRGVNP